MNAQLAFFIVAIVAFVVAAVFVGLSVYTFINQDILSVRDDLSGKRRQRDLQDGSAPRAARPQKGKRAEESVVAPGTDAKRGAGSRRSPDGSRKRDKHEKRGKKPVAASDASGVAKPVAPVGTASGARAAQPDDDVTLLLDGEGDDRTVVLAGKQGESERKSAKQAVGRTSGRNAVKGTSVSGANPDRMAEKIPFRVIRKEVHVDEGVSVIR